MKRWPLVVVVAVAALLPMTATAQASTLPADVALQRFLQAFIRIPGASPGIGVVVHRGSQLNFHTAGVADVQTGASFRLDDHMRLASVAKAFSGAAVHGLIPPSTTIGSLRPDLPAAWHGITLAQLLNHTSGIPDFSKTDAFIQALLASLLVPPPPRQLLSYVENLPLLFPPGSRYQYSNSDNIVVGLLAEAATGLPYETVLAQRVYGPFGLTRTSLPSGPNVPNPKIHGYAESPPEDVTELFAAGWTWASGGIVSTPRDADRFVRNWASLSAGGPFQSGSSEPPGPGTNSAGRAIFRYQTACGTVYGHTGNTAGYTQFIAATADGSRSTVVSVNRQITPASDLRVFTELRRVFQYAVCAALA